MLEGLERVLEHCPELRLVGTAPSLEEMLAQIKDLHPQIVLLGQTNPQRQLLAQIPQVITELPNCRIVLWVVESPEQDVFRALHLGVRGVVQKTMPVQSLVSCLRAVAAGNVWIDEPDHFFAEANGSGKPNIRITPREREIIELICRGLKTREIADHLQITPDPVTA